MPKLDPRIEHLRDVTIEAIERLMDAGKNLSYKGAVYRFYLRAHTHKIATGFDLENVRKFYQAVIYWKRTAAARLARTSTNLNSDDSDNDMMCSDLW